MRAKKRKEEEKNRKWFIVMNSNLEYFCGLAYGGQCVWDKDYNEAKPLDDEAKFHTLKALCYTDELIMDYI